jgi:hypothetical protein
MIVTLKGVYESINEENSDNKGRVVRARTPVEDKTYHMARAVSLSPLFGNQNMHRSPRVFVGLNTLSTKIYKKVIADEKSLLDNK